MKLEQARADAARRAQGKPGGAAHEAKGEAGHRGEASRSANPTAPKPVDLGLAGPTNEVGCMLERWLEVRAHLLSQLSASVHNLSPAALGGISFPPE